MQRFGETFYIILLVRILRHDRDVASPDIPPSADMNNNNHWERNNHSQLSNLANDGCTDRVVHAAFP